MRLKNNAILIGKVAGIPIRLHISLPIVVLIFAGTAGSGFLVVIILALGLFGSVALHELGHSLVAQKKGSYIHEIVLYPFGGAAKIMNIPKKPMDEIWVALAGPGVSLVLALFFQGIGVGITNHLSSINWMLFLFNMLPIFPMDGGRVLRAGLCMKKSRVEATRIAATLAKYFCQLFIVIGIVNFIRTSFYEKNVMVGFANNVVLVIIGFYIYAMGRNEYRQVLLEHQIDHFSGFREDHVDIKVSPPPYASKTSQANSMLDKLKKRFRKP
ncbi:MAG: site-2 protease family protein [Pontiellaceae bacterium]|nr:site-2 protease family protein [Pontiellaceae bacterium]